MKLYEIFTRKRYCLGNSSRANEETRSCLVKKRRMSDSNIEARVRNVCKFNGDVKVSRSRDRWTADNEHSWLKKQNSNEQGTRSDKGSIDNTTEPAIDTAMGNKSSPSVMRNSRPFSSYAFESRRKEGESGTFHALPAGRSILGREAQGGGKNEPPNKVICGLEQV